VRADEESPREFAAGYLLSVYDGGSHTSEKLFLQLAI